MQITGVFVDSFKGFSRRLDITSKCVLFSGPMGAGKTTILEAIAISLGLNTRLGSTNMDRLSRTGAWSVGISLAGEHGVRALERRHSGNKSAYVLNGRVVPVKEYLDAVATVTNVEPHHCDLRQFLDLSGQKRAEMFAEFASAQTTDVDQMVQARRQAPLRQVLGDLLNDNTEIVEAIAFDLAKIAGTPTEVTDAVRQLQTQWTTKNRDARARHASLLEREAAQEHALTPAELQAKLSEADQSIGTLQNRRQEIEAQATRYQSAYRLVEDARTEIQRAQAAVAAAEKAAGEVESLRQKCKEDEAALAAASTEVESLEQRLDEAQSASSTAALATSVAQTNRNIGSVLLSKPWSVDAVEVVSRVNKCADGKFVFEPGDADLLVEMAKEVLVLVLGGRDSGLIVAQQQAEAKSAAAVAAVNDIKRSLTQAKTKKSECERTLATQRRALEAKETAAGQLEATKQALEERTTRAAQLEQEAQRLSIQDDPTVLDTELAEANQARKALADQLKASQEAKAISGQVEESRLQIAQTDAAVGALKAIVEICQTARDEATRDGIDRIIEPFQKTFSCLFGMSAKVGTVSKGTGRSTEFAFNLSRRRHDVPLEMLSDGETVLASAAFLAALQNLNGCNGRLLLANDTGLDDEGLQRFIHGVPRFNLDFVALTTSRALPKERQSWQVVEIE